MPPAFALELKEYSESQDHPVAETPEPTRRSQTLIYHFEDCQWWIKVAFLGTLFQLDEAEPTYKIQNANDAMKLEEEDEITDGAHRVFCKTDGVTYVLKVVNRPLYYSHDTEVIRKELENLELFRSVPGTVQSAGIAVSPNPYSTTRTSEQPSAITGVLLEFYRGGSLEKIFKEDRVKEHKWQRWPIQIGTALSHIYEAGKTHMDNKPANVVLDAEGSAVLIDTSGIGGMTYSWLAPEIRHKESLFHPPFEARLLHGTWTYGKLLSEMAALTETLLCVAERLMEENTRSRMSLLDAVSQLNDYAGREERFSVSSGVIN